MQFVKPIPFQEAIDKLGRRSPIGSVFSSSEWRDVPAELREGAFFMSRVEGVRVLQRGRDAIGDFLSANRETLPDGQTALKVGSRQQFVDQMQTFLAAEGIDRTSGGLTDITSERRLGLVFDTQTQQLQDYGYWKQGMDQDVLDEFPAQRFIRIIDVKEPRNSHTEFEGKVYLKTDPIWAERINQDFGVPWGPWGWGCGHDVEDVDRSETEEIGLLQPDQAVQPDTRNFAENMQASARGLDPDLLAKLKGEFGDRLTIDGDVMRWNSAVPATAPMPVPTPQAKPVPLPKQSPAIPVTVPAQEQSDRRSPVSGAIKTKVRGNLGSQVKAALGAIDKVHDDGILPTIPLESYRGNHLGVFKSRGIGLREAVGISVNPKGPWPALNAVHETGHFLDLSGIGVPGTFATEAGHAGMSNVIAAARKSKAFATLEKRLVESGNLDEQDHVRYLMSKKELWARAYAQFVAERSEAPILTRQLKLAVDAEPGRQWDTDDFKAVAEAIEGMFKKLGWL
jgi:hypothetical protein